MALQQLFRRFDWLALAVFLMVFLLGPDTGTSIQSSTIQVQPLRISVGDKAPDFALPSGGGKTVKLSDLAGHNALIDFYRGYW